MAMGGQRSTPEQVVFVATSEISAAENRFYRALNGLLGESGFDRRPGTNRSPQRGGRMSAEAWRGDALGLHAVRIRELAASLTAVTTEIADFIDAADAHAPSVYQVDIALEKLGGTLALGGCAWAAGHTGRPPPGRACSMSGVPAILDAQGALGGILLVASAASEARPFDDDNHQVAGLVVGGTAVVLHAWSGISGNDYRRHCMRQWRELLEQKQTPASEADWTAADSLPRDGR